jgi:hypothetical protein
VAEHDFPSHSIKLEHYPIQSQPPVDTQQGIFALLPILTQLAGSVVSGAISQNGIQAGTAYYPGKPLPPDVQQGIFDVFTSVLKNPIFTNVVTGIVKDLAKA